jgi:hypothetical protein
VLVRKGSFRLSAALGVAVALMVASGPALAAPAHGPRQEGTPLPLGTFTPTTDPQPKCPPEHTCSSFTVACPNVHPDRRGWLAVGMPSGTATGFVLFYSGAGGQKWTSQQHAGLPEMIGELRTAGLVTAMVRWRADWRRSPIGRRPGLATLGCAPATVTRYVHDALYTPLGIPDAATGVCGFCVTGNSGGSSQAAYQLSHYGLDSLIDAMVLVGGPPYSVLAKSCLTTEGETPYWFQAPEKRSNVDIAYGYAEETGPCYLNDAAFKPRWLTDSHVAGAMDLVHPSTRIHFLWGEKDRNMRAVGGDYEAAIVAAGSALVSSQIVLGAGHRIFELVEGRAAWRDAILGATG